jgi:RND family efflux transporter MFP subunit
MQKIDFKKPLNWAQAVLAGLSIGACCLALAPAPAAPAEGSAANQFPGHTAPSEKRDQNFDLPGVVDKVLVKEGDRVKAGQLIAQQDTDAEQAHLQAAELIANSTLEIKAEEAQAAKDKIDLTRKAELLKQMAISPSEYDEAKLAVTIDEYKAEHAREDKQKATYEVAEEKAKIHEKNLFARIDGVVSQISTHEGELANSDTQHPTITIVKNDPLYVEVDLPADLIRRLKVIGLKTPLQVHYVDELDKSVWHDARIHFIKPEADPTSNYEHVQLEMANPELRSGGLQVMVRVPDNVAGG